MTAVIQTRTKKAQQRAATSREPVEIPWTTVELNGSQTKTTVRLAPPLAAEKASLDLSHFLATISLAEKFKKDFTNGQFNDKQEKKNLRSQSP